MGTLQMIPERAASTYDQWSIYALAEAKRAGRIPAFRWQRGPVFSKEGCRMRRALLDKLIDQLWKIVRNV